MNQSIISSNSSIINILFSIYTVYYSIFDFHSDHNSDPFPIYHVQVTIVIVVSCKAYPCNIYVQRRTSTIPYHTINHLYLSVINCLSYHYIIHTSPHNYDPSPYTLLHRAWVPDEVRQRPVLAYALRSLINQHLSDGVAGVLQEDTDTLWDAYKVYI